MRAPVLFLLALFTFSLTAGGRELAPRPIAPTTYETSLASSASAGGRFLTAWAELNELGTHIRGAFSDERGRRVTSVSLTLVPNAYPVWLQVVGTGDSFALFWRDARQVLHMADVDLQGNVSNVRTLELPVHFAARVGWNGSRFLVAIRSGVAPTYRTEALLLDRGGDVVRRGIALDELAISFDVVTSNGGFVVITSGHYGVGAFRVRESGGERIPIEAATGLGGSIAKAAPAPDGSVLIVWSNGGPMSGELRSARLAPDGSVSPSVRIVSESSGVFTPLAVMRSSSEYVLAYVQQSADLRQSVVKSLTLDASGARVGDVRSGPEVSSATAAAGDGVILAVTKLVAESWVRGLPIDQSGIAFEGEPLALAPSRQTQAALAAGGGRFLASWTQVGGLAAYTWSALLSQDGEPQRTATVAPGFVAADDVVWNGAEFLVVHRDTTHLMATRLDANGEAIHAQPIVLAELRNLHWLTRPAAAVWTDSGWLVVWTSSGELWLTTISAAGVPGGPRSLTLDTPLPQEWFRSYEVPALAYDGASVLLVWHEAQNEICFFPVCSQGRSFDAAVRLSRTGEVLEPPVVLPTGTSGTTWLSAASSGRELVVLSGTTAMVLDGPLGALRVEAKRDLLESLAASDLTWDGREYIAAFRYRRVEPTLAVHRFDTALRESSAPRGIMTLPPGWQPALSIAAASSSGAAIAIDEVALDGSRVTVYHEKELVPLPVRRRTVRSR